MPVVEVKWYKGRSLEQKRQVADAVEDAMCAVGVPAGVTHVVFIWCQGCENRIKADPDKYLAKLDK